MIIQNKLKFFDKLGFLKSTTTKKKENSFQLKFYFATKEQPRTRHKPVCVVEEKKNKEPFGNVNSQADFFGPAIKL